MYGTVLLLRRCCKLGSCGTVLLLRVLRKAARKEGNCCRSCGTVSLFYCCKLGSCIVVLLYCCLFLCWLG